MLCALLFILYPVEFSFLRGSYLSSHSNDDDVNINELANKSSTKNKPGGDRPSNALAIHFWMEALLPDGRDTDGRAAPLPPDNSDCDSIHSNVDG
jgi:hypothetical protein